MNVTEHLLQCLQEEAAEVIKAASKSNRFGLQDGYPGTTRINELDLAEEIRDFLAIVELLEERGIIHSDCVRNPVDIQVKKLKVVSYMQYARDRGMLIGE